MKIKRTTTQKKNKKNHKAHDSNINVKIELHLKINLTK